MKITALILLMLAVIGLAGCAGTPRVPQCEGPWTPINPPIETADEA